MIAKIRKISFFYFKWHKAICIGFFFWQMYPFHYIHLQWLKCFSSTQLNASRSYTLTSSAFTFNKLNCFMFRNITYDMDSKCYIPTCNILNIWILVKDTCKYMNDFMYTKNPSKTQLKRSPRDQWNYFPISVIRYTYICIMNS